MAIKDIGFLKLLFATATDTPNLDPRTGQDPIRSGSNGASQSLYVRHGYEDVYEHLAISQDLIKRFIDYENMDDHPLISSAFDIYADEITQMDYKRRAIMWTESLDEKTRNETDAFLSDVLHVEDQAWEIARTLAKYGNDFESLIYDATGVKGLDYVSPATVRRSESQGKTAFIVNQDGDFKTNDFEIIKAVGDNVRYLEKSTLLDNWEMVHFRLRTKNRGSRYGYGIAENARAPWKRLLLLEDATVLYKLTRSPNRLAYYVNTGSKSPKEAKSYMKELQREYRKKSFINQKTGKLEFQQHPLAQQEDIWIGVRDSKDPTRVENLPSMDYQSLDELTYYRNMTFAGLKMSKRVLSWDETSDSRTAAANEDIRFARSALRVQRELLNGYMKTIGVHYALQGRDYRNIDMALKMAIPSTAFEIAQLEVENTKVALAAQLDPFLSKEWILTRILGMSESDAQFVLKQKTKEMSTELKAQNQALQASAPDMAPAESLEHLRKTYLQGKEEKFRDSRQWALIESKLDRKLDEVKNSGAVNSQRFTEMKRLLMQILAQRDGVSLKKINDADGGENDTDTARFFQ